ncbi:hypothetical protein HY486_00010 [Candidatus Woesearchaeota archaeon]|nr:hypothetical protein [Candidatus Woesearchaeota archaeon]
MTPTTERAQAVYHDWLNEEFAKQPEPVIVMAVLRMVCHNSLGCYISSIPKHLEIGEQQTEQALVFLEKEELITRQNPETHRYKDRELLQAHPTDNGKAYACSISRLGKNISTWNDLSREQAFQIINTARPIVTLNYEKTYSIGGDSLAKLKREIKQGIETLAEREKQIIKQEVGLPKSAEFYLGFATFQDRTWDDQAGRIDPLSFSVSLKYNTLDDAMNAGIDRVSAHLKLETPIDVENETHTHAPTALHLYKNRDSYTIYCTQMLGRSADIWKRPIRYQKAVLSRNDQLANLITPLFQEKQKKRL